MLPRGTDLWDIWYGLKFSLDIEFWNIILESNCLQAVQNGEKGICDIVDAIIMLIAKNVSFSCYFFSKKINK